MKKVIKLILLLLSFIIIFSLITTNYTYADIDTNSFNPWDTQPEGIDSETVTKYTNKVLGPLATVGVIVSVIAIMILGLKFIIGSATEKAEYKKHLVPVVLGICIIVFIFSILGILNSLGESINNGAGQQQFIGPRKTDDPNFIGPTKP